MGRYVVLFPQLLGASNRMCLTLARELEARCHKLLLLEKGHPFTKIPVWIISMPASRHTQTTP
jgi:hypothetical protein